MIKNIKLKIEKCMVILLLIVLTIVMRTHFQHQFHFDSFVIMNKAMSIIKFGYAEWVLEPLSLFGYYPLSYPSGFMYFLASFSLVTGLDMHTTIYVVSILLAFITLVGMYLLLQEFNNITLSLIVLLILTTTSNFVVYTSNTASARIFAICLYPFFIFSLFKIYKAFLNGKGLAIKVKYIFLSVLLFVLMALAHRLSQLSLIFTILSLKSFKYESKISNGIIVVFALAIKRAKGFISVPKAFIPLIFASTKEVPVPQYGSNKVLTFLPNSSIILPAT